jgi:Fe/S biogenesis protein NfuA
VTEPAPALLAITASALERVRRFLAASPEPSDRVLSVRITGESNGEYVCALSLEPRTQVRAIDCVQHQGDLTVVVPHESVAKLNGATVDTDLARRVMAVLDRDVNPAIASHGGHAELAAVEGATAYLRLGGGCQGCGMATVTLSQGIEVAITQAVPEIDSVVDVTDHASGTNPYFEPAKK